MSAIKVGDNVLIIRGHCSNELDGKEAVVVLLDDCPFMFCARCRERLRLTAGAHLRIGPFTGWLPVKWLMKLDDGTADTQPAEREIENV